MAAGAAGTKGKGKSNVKEVVKTMNKSYQEMQPLMNVIAKKLTKNGLKMGR